MKRNLQMPKKILTGTVVSNKMNKTVVVAVDISKKHPVYGKNVRNTKRFKVHVDEKFKLGAIVTIEESRPFSKEVNWVVVKE